MKPETCPRCTGLIPNNESPGAYPGALSRVADVEICSACGADEAMSVIRDGLVAPYDWPMAEPHRHVPQVGAA